METGVKEGMCIMENVVLELYNQKKISKQTALINVSTRNVRQKIEPSASTAAPMARNPDFYMATKSHKDPTTGEALKAPMGSRRLPSARLMIFAPFRG